MIVIALIALIAVLTYCSSGPSEGKVLISTNYSYTAEEALTLAIINEYRVNNGLNALERDGFVSLKCEEHSLKMASDGLVSHNGFVERAASITKAYGSTIIGENVAYDYNTAKGVVNAWIASPEHKKNMEGDYTHFGISIREDSLGRKYYTNIFIKK